MKRDLQPYIVGIVFCLVVLYIALRIIGCWYKWR